MAASIEANDPSPCVDQGLHDTGLNPVFVRIRSESVLENNGRSCLGTPRIPRVLKTVGGKKLGGRV
jgi:hypothetical protein